MTDAAPNPLSLIAEGMIRFREEMEANDRLSRSIAAKTKGIFKYAVLLLAAMIVMVLFHILAMRSELMAMITNLDNMYMDFGIMAKNVNGMTNQMGSIGARVTELPSIAVDMSAINQEVWSMRTAVGGMNHSIGTMNTDMAVLRDTTREMTHHFRGVQQAVDHINYNVGHMMRPMSVFPR